jgi:hypothetical protein
MAVDQKLKAFVRAELFKCGVNASATVVRIPNAKSAFVCMSRSRKPKRTARMRAVDIHLYDPSAQSIAG